MIKVLKEKQISYLQSVPAYINNMLEFLPKYDDSNLNTLRTLDIGGKLSIVMIRNIVLEFCRRRKYSSTN